MSSKIGEKKVRPGTRINPEPIPLKGLLEENGQSQVWLRDQLSKRLGENVDESKLSRILSGRRPAPDSWTRPLLDIFPYTIHNVDEARRLLGLDKGDAEDGVEP